MITTQRRRPSLTEALIALTRRGPVHAILVIIGIIWLVPSVGLAVTSFRTRGDISASGWWTIASGNRTITDQLLGITMSSTAAIAGGNTIIAGDSLRGALLEDAVEGVPAATIRLVRVEKITGEIIVSRNTISLSRSHGVGTVIVREDGSYNFAPAENYADALVLDVEAR